MFVVVQHTISDPATFWATAERSVATLPAGVRLMQVLPNAGGTRSVCLWQGDSVETVRRVIEETVGHVSTNEYFAVDEKSAVGLPGAVPGVTSPAAQPLA